MNDAGKADTLKGRAELDVEWPYQA